MLVAAVEHTDPERASRNSRRSTPPLDVEHEAVMSEVLDGAVETTVLFDFRNAHPRSPNIAYENKQQYLP
jgi:hypothetical protein